MKLCHVGFIKHIHEISEITTKFIFKKFYLQTKGTIIDLTKYPVLKILIHVDLLYKSLNEIMAQRRKIISPN